MTGEVISNCVVRQREHSPHEILIDVELDLQYEQTEHQAGVIKSLNLENVNHAEDQSQ